jgi:hypothetical protein
LRLKRERSRRNRNGGPRLGQRALGERRDGQPFLFDITLELSEPGEDEIDATVDYRGVRDAVRVAFVELASCL